MPLKYPRHHFQCLTSAEWQYIIHGNRGISRTQRAYTSTSKQRQDTPHQPIQEQKAKRIFSGIQPTGIPHLGNYLGALQTWKNYQDEVATGTRHLHHQLFFSVVDLHALTSPVPAHRRRELTRESYAALMAMGLTNTHSTLFLQSHVPGHTELMWILSTIASTGYLSRMTQWKAKLGIMNDAEQVEPSAENDNIALDSLTETQREKLKLGLFSYPVLQAADILLYKADIVPIGEDQIQHLELTRHLARQFNKLYPSKGASPLVRVPEIVVSPAKRIMSLAEPTQKMSKSDPKPNATILITDTPETIERKIMAARTDSITGITYDPIQRPGVSNLLSILAHTENQGHSPQQLAAELAPLSMKALKSLVAQSVIGCLAGIEPVFRELMADKTRKIEVEMTRGAAAANATAERTMYGVRKAMGAVMSAPGDREKAYNATGADKKRRKMEQEASQASMDQEWIESHSA